MLDVVLVVIHSKKMRVCNTLIYWKLLHTNKINVVLIYIPLPICLFLQHSPLGKNNVINVLLYDV